MRTPFYGVRRMTVEAEIVENANGVLDRLSGGTLSIALDDRESRTGGQKALGLVAYNRQTGGKAEPVGMLSGSQRFRVSLALALGIGQFASRGDRAVESVIIDEGFGGLDKDGRRSSRSSTSSRSTRACAASSWSRTRRSSPAPSRTPTTSRSSTRVRARRSSRHDRPAASAASSATVIRRRIAPTSGAFTHDSASRSGNAIVSRRRTAEGYPPDAVRFFGRPPFAPFARAASRLASVEALPPRRPSSAIQAREPNAPASSAGTL